MRLVLDINVLVAAMRSPKGASAAVLRAVRAGRVDIACTVALFLEYEAVMKRAEHLAAANLSAEDVDTLLRVVAVRVIPAPPARTRRPRLADPDDELVWESAETAAVDALVTFEVRTFGAIGAAYGVSILTPRQVCERLPA